MDDFVVVWETAELGRSEIRMLGHGQQQSQYDWPSRLFWPNAEGLTVMDISMPSVKPEIEPHVAWGTMGPGTLHGRTYGDHFSDTADLWYMSGMKITLAHYGDLECDESN